MLLCGASRGPTMIDRLPKALLEQATRGAVNRGGLAEMERDGRRLQL